MSGSKIVQQRQRKANAVEAAALANRRRVNQALAAKMERLGVVEDEPVDPEILVDVTPDGEVLEAVRLLADPDRPQVPDLDNLQRFAGWMVGLARDRIRLVDRQTQAERHDDVDPRNQRDAAVERAYRALVDLRRIVKGALGDAAVVRYLAIEGNLSQSTLAVANQLEDTIERLTDPELELPEIEADWMALDWDRLIASLRERLAPLQTALRELDRQQRAAELAVIQKEEALREFQDDYVGWSNVLRGLYVAASERELASRLSPTVPTRSGGGELEDPANDDLPEDPGFDPGLSDEDDEDDEDDGVDPTPEPVVPLVANDPEPAEAGEQVSGDDVA